MLTLRQIRRKIRGTQKTRQITRTMQMVSASRLKRSEGRLYQARPYARKLEELLIRLSATGQYSHPFFDKREVKNIGLVIVTADRGLCGSYNTNIIFRAEGFLKSQDKNAKIFLIGKKGFDYFKKRNWEILEKVLDLGGKLDYKRIEGITDKITRAYLTGIVDEVYLLYTAFYSALSYETTLVKFLNIERSSETQGDVGIQYIFEPGVSEIFDRLLPRYATTKVYISLAEAFTSENAARMMAMKLATDNAEEMIDMLTLMRNKARQAAITKEITEIVTAAEALK